MRTRVEVVQGGLRVTLLFVVLVVPEYHGISQTPPLSKYGLIFSSAKMDSVNREFVGPGSFFRLIPKAPENQPALNAFIPLVQDLPADTNTSWRTFTKIRNRWSETLVRGDLNFCDLLESKVPIYKVIYTASNFPAACPVPKGNYTIVDFTYKFGSNDLPPVAMGTEWRIRNWWTTGDKPILAYSLEVTVERRQASSRT